MDRAQASSTCRVAASRNWVVPAREMISATHFQHDKLALDWRCLREGIVGAGVSLQQQLNSAYRF